MRRDTLRDPDRFWSAVMTGDIVRDRTRKPWSVLRVAHEGAGVWVELGDGVETRTLHVPWSGDLVEMTEGPGWGVAALDDAAMTWAMGLVGAVLGGTVVSPGEAMTTT